MDVAGVHPGRIAHPWRILIVDDSPVERLALAHFLRGEEFVVDEAGDGHSALLHLQHRPVDLLILDLHMPGQDGFDVLGYIQQHRPGLPVVLLSGMPVDEIQYKMHNLPKRELPPLLLKPINLDQILDVIEMELSGELPGNEN